jgi:uncharacterized protein YkwD
MLRVDGRVLAASVVGVFVVGAILGLFIGGVGAGTQATDADPTATPVPDEPAADTPAATAGVTQAGSTVTAATGTPTRTAPPAPTSTATPTMAPTPTLTPTPTAALSTPVTPSEMATRTPMLVRRFDTGEIEYELRGMLNEWREEQGLEPFRVDNGTQVAELNAMAKSHSVAMADADRLAYKLDGRTSADRYRANELYLNCVFNADHNAYVVTPSENDLEVMAKSYAGTTYRTANGTDYNPNETAVAEDVFDFWMANDIHRDKLAERNASRIGIGIETTNDNEVFVTGNLCGR